MSAIQSPPVPQTFLDEKRIPEYRTSPSLHGCTHGPSQTPNLDAALQHPTTRVHFARLSTAFDKLSRGEDNCTKCTQETLVPALMDALRDLQAAKTNGMWSAEDKKALKREWKSLGKAMKTGFKGALKAEKAIWKAESKR